MGLILSSIIVLTGLVVLCISLGQYLPYVLTGLLFIGIAWILSIPIRDILEQREQRKLNRMNYEQWVEWNKKNNKDANNR